jgi:integrase
MTVADYVAWFWGPKGHYLVDREEAGKPLSGKYIDTCWTYIRKHISTWDPFKTLTIAELEFRHVDSFTRHLRNNGNSRHVVDRTVDALRTPTNWGSARGYCKKIDYAGLVLPEKINRERGILTNPEVLAILSLPTTGAWQATDSKLWHVDAKPRPRLAGGRKHGGTGPVDPRMKAFVLLGLFAGLRRGEERGLRWGAVDLERGILNIHANYQDGDGMKKPKKGSSGLVPLAPELLPILTELQGIARLIGLDGPGDYVLANTTSPAEPVSNTTLRRGWVRILDIIGIDEGQRKRRHLVPHGTRHAFATRLLDGGMSRAETAKLTRHKSLAMVDNYGGHLSPETVERARVALNVGTEPEGGKA